LAIYFNNEKLEINIILLSDYLLLTTNDEQLMIDFIEIDEFIKIKHVEVIKLIE
jgi:hypothetical protein